MFSEVTLNQAKTIHERPLTRVNKPQQTSVVPLESSKVSFNGNAINYVTHPILSMQTLSKITDPELKKAYIEVHKATDRQGKADLKFLLDTGKLLSNDADDKSNTLQNLLKIVKEPRAKGLDSTIILNCTLRALANPFSIPQTFGDIDESTAKLIVKDPNHVKILQSMGLDVNHLPENVKQFLPKDYNVDASGTCVAASVEFNLADKRPAEYARYAADLTSPNMSVVEDFKFTDVCESYPEAVYWLDQFNIPYEAAGFEGGKATLKPDSGAVFRAISQCNNRKPGTRSPVDELMQSTFMQLGSAHSYNSLNDIRTGGFNQQNRGLTEFEKSMLEAVVDDNGGKSSVTYQLVDDNAFLQGFTKDYQKTLLEIVNSLKAGSNVIVGITETDPSAKIVGGHELTVVATEIGQDGKLYFKCNDTDDTVDEPVRISAEELIPKIHHAGIPNIVIRKEQENQVKTPVTIEKPFDPTRAVAMDNPFKSFMQAASAPSSMNVVV